MEKNEKSQRESLKFLWKRHS